MSGQEMFDRVARALRVARTVAICPHVDPDGDAIGSALGLMHILRQAGIAGTPVLPANGGLPGAYAFLPGAERFVPVSAAPEPDVVVGVDSPSLDRLGDGATLAFRAQTLVMIDHHPDAEPPDGALAIIDPAAAAAGCLFWRLAASLGVSCDAQAATCLYAALLTDTGRFSYSNTTAEALRTAADMVDAGARPSDIYAAVYENRSSSAQALLARVLMRVTKANKGHVAYSWVTSDDLRQTGAQAAEADDLIDHIRTIGGVDVVLLVKAMNGRARVNLRAKGDVDVGAVARALGGGGHRAAAGLTLPGDLHEALRVLLPMLPGSAG